MKQRRKREITLQGPIEKSFILLSKYLKKMLLDSTKIHGFFSVLLPIQLLLFYALKALAKSNGNLFAIAIFEKFII